VLIALLLQLRQPAQAQQRLPVQIFLLVMRGVLQLTPTPAL